MRKDQKSQALKLESDLYKVKKTVSRLLKRHLSHTPAQRRVFHWHTFPGDMWSSHILCLQSVMLRLTSCSALCLMNLQTHCRTPADEWLECFRHYNEFLCAARMAGTFEFFLSLCHPECVRTKASKGPAERPNRIGCLKIAGRLFRPAGGCLTQLFFPTRDFQRLVCCWLS